MRTAIRAFAAAVLIAGGLAVGGTGIAQASCPANDYVNSSGNCVPDPQAPSGGGAAPAGASAICRDSDYSFSQHHTGTCSGHGGVSQWL